MAAVDTSRAASIIVVTGASGSGKSVWVKRHIKTARRCIVWDIDDEYSGQGFERVTTPGRLVEIISSAKAARVAFVARPALFDLWARCAFAWGGCVAVAEELAGVTSPGKAPDGWHQLVTRGRKRGVNVIGITQRPSESDKTIMGNASLIHCCQMVRAQDRAYMAKEMDINQQMVNDLQPLEFIEKDQRTGQIKRGKLTFSR